MNGLGETNDPITAPLAERTSTYATLRDLARSRTPVARSFRNAALGPYPEKMLDLGFDAEELAAALADQTDYEHRWLTDPRTGHVAFCTRNPGIVGENSAEIHELDLVLIDPLPSSACREHAPGTAVSDRRWPWAF